MAKGINKVILVGHLGDDPDMRYGQYDNAVCNVSVATTEQWKDRDGNKQERTEWHRCVSFGKLAEIMGEYLTKGSLVYLEGKLRTEKYTDNNGVEKYSTKVYVDEMNMLGGGQDRGGERGQDRGQSRDEGRRSAPAQGRSSRQAPARNQRPAPRSAPPQDDLPDDDIPF